MAEEEVAMELEAVQAVYGDECVVLDSYPPHLHLRIKPRTADVSSQQFVEAVIGIRASPKEAVAKLSAMNHPDGDCPLCLYPLFRKDKNVEVLPFMKLMSCFHCFHSECIVRWWNWLQNGIETDSCATVHPNTDMRNQKDMLGPIDGNMGTCPVCRKVFHVKDLEHVLNLVGSQSSHLSSNGNEVDDDDKYLHSDSENIRRQKFEAILKLQEENSGLIEPKRDLVVLPGMFLPQPATLPTPTSTKETTEQEQGEQSAPAEINATGSSNRASGSKHWNSGMRKRRGRNLRNQRQWIRKDDSSVN
ncbi:RWD domain-containing protein [Citrus sinensis]|uniref:RWD domain-containing protein n=1 Tax=Citrus sinensis TaxID=2711 RepID=A0ACB8MS79_CITSI|nr:RWD domain-containing protein [Citrus sinensis]